MSRVSYDTNILNLQPQGLESVQWQHQLEHDAGANIWSGLVLTTPADAANMIESLRNVPGVGGVSGMGMLFPPDAVQRELRLKHVREQTPTPVELTDPQERLTATLELIATGLRTRGGSTPQAASLANDITQSIASWKSVDDSIRTDRMDAITLACCANSMA